MASTVGHSLAGLTIYLVGTPRARVGRTLRAEWGRIGGLMALANVPDLDLAVGIAVWGDAGRIHGGVSHGLPFAALMAAGLACAWPGPGPRSRSFLLYFAVAASHGLIDLFTSFRGIGWVPTAGVAILAPLVPGKVELPVAFFYGVAHGSLDRLLSLHNVVVVVYDSVVFGAAAGIVVAVKAARARR